MPEITDEYMQVQLATSREYVLVLLKEGENTSPPEAAEIVAGDPAVAAGIFTYEVRTFRSFPGDALVAAAADA